MRRENFLELDPEAPAGTGGTEGAAGTVVGWNRVALRAIRAARPGPLATARSLAILHTSMYNAWAAYDPSARQTAHGVAVRLPQLERTAASKASAMSHAAWRALSGCLPGQQAVFDAWMARLGLDPAAPGSHLSPAGIGRTQAASMLDFCHRHGHASRLGGLPDAAPVAEPAPGRWCLAAQRLSAREGHGDDQDVRLFFALAGALTDAAIAGWGLEPDKPAALQGSAGAAAVEVLDRFTGRRGEPQAGAGPAGQARGRQVGARAFEDARRHWEGRL